MLAYVIRRFLILIPTLLGVSVIVFLMLHMTPGDPAELLLGERATLESLEQMREHLGLNEPLHVQYGLFLKRLLKGDLGETIWTRQKVWTEVKQRFPATIENAAEFISRMVEILSSSLPKRCGGPQISGLITNRLSEAQELLHNYKPVLVLGEAFFNNEVA